MQNKYILILIFIILLGCSKDENMDLSNSVNIFQPENKISFLNKEETDNSQLGNLSDIKEILNSKSYNIKNSKINYPFKKQWQINTEQSIDDRNPYLPDPLFFDSNIYLLNTKGYLFKINSNDVKFILKKKNDDWNPTEKAKYFETCIPTNPKKLTPLFSVDRTTLTRSSGSPSLGLSRAVTWTVTWIEPGREFGIPKKALKPF